MDFRKPLIALTIIISLFLGISSMLSAQGSIGGGDTEISSSMSLDDMSTLKSAASMGKLAWWEKLLISFGWIIVTTIGFAIGIGFALFVFDLITVDIEEWKEIANGNLAVAIVFATIIVSIGIVVYNVI